MVPRNIFSRFMACRQGSFLILAALVLVVLLGLVGLAVDTARATLVRNNMQAAADVAVLAAGATYRSEMLNPSVTSAAALQAARVTAERYFLANLRTGIIETPPGQLLDNFTFTQLPGNDLEVTYTTPVTLGLGRFSNERTTVEPAVVARVGLNGGQTVTRLPLELVYVVDSSRSMKLCTAPAPGTLPAGSTCWKPIGRNPNGTLRTAEVPGIDAAAALRESLNTSIDLLFDINTEQDKLHSKIIVYNSRVIADGAFTRSKSTLKAQMNSYNPDFDTNILTPVQRADSALSAFVSPAAQTAGQRAVEVIILMSDGRHNIQPPMTAINNNLDIQPVINACGDFVREAPETVRREVFTIFFRNQNADTEAQRLLHDCASKPEYAFTADDQDELTAAYRSITQEVIQIRTISQPRLTL